MNSNWFCADGHVDLLMRKMKLLALLLATGFSAVATADQPINDSPQQRLVIDAKPVPETAQKLRVVFARATELAVFTTPESEMGRLGFSKEMARDQAGYTFVADCRGTCEITYRSLLGELSKGLRIRGNCPGSVSTVLELRHAERAGVTPIYLSSGSQCFELGQQAYFLPSQSLEEKLAALVIAMK